MTGATEPPARLAGLALLLVLAQAAAGDESRAREWLDRASQAAMSLNYDGTFVYRNGDWMQSIRIIHRADPEQGSQARLVSLSGEAREVIRDANRVTCYLPDSASVVVSNTKPRAVTSSSVFNPQGDFSRHYSLTLADGERVAGRPTRLLSVMPRDGLRYGYRLWVDEETGILLKSELVDAAGTPLEQIVYTRLELPETIPDDLLRPAVAGEGFTWYTSDAPRSETRESRWRVGWLPPGFEMRDRATDPAGIGRMPVEHLVYTDGLASVSIFIEHLDGAGERLEGLSGMGAVNAFGAMVEGYQVTVVGELPGATVERIGESVARR